MWGLFQITFEWIYRILSYSGNRPATNTITMSVVLKTLGKKSLAIYLSSVLMGSLVFGFLFDSFFSDSLSTINLLNIHEDDPGFIAQVSSVVLLCLSLRYLFDKNAKVIGGGGCESGDCGGGSCSS